MNINPITSANQDGRPLDYWTSADLARVSPPGAPSRLRQLADAQGAVAAAWSSAIGAGPVLLLAGSFATAVSGNFAWVLVLAPSGAALTALGLVSWRRVRGSLPNTSRTYITRGPGSARGGIMMAAALAIILGGILAAAAPGIADRGGAALTSVGGAYVFVVALLVAAILVPSVVMGRARQSFRRRIEADPGLRSAVEHDLATWHDRHGISYGPL